MQKDEESTVEIPLSLANRLMDDMRRLEVFLSLHRQAEASLTADTGQKRRSR